MAPEPTDRTAEAVVHHPGGEHDRGSDELSRLRSPDTDLVHLVPHDGDQREQPHGERPPERRRKQPSPAVLLVPTRARPPDEMPSEGGDHEPGTERDDVTEHGHLRLRPWERGIALAANAARMSAP